MRNLDKEDLKPKKNKKITKKTIIVGTSTVIIVTLLCGTIVCNLMKNSDNTVVRIARSMMSGTILERILGASANDGVDFAPNLSEGEILALESYLSKCGFGYNESGAYRVGDAYKNLAEDYEFNNEKDGSNRFIKIEALYALAENKNLTGFEEGSNPEDVKPPYATDPGPEPVEPKEPKKEDYGIKNTTSMFDDIERWYELYESGDTSFLESFKFLDPNGKILDMFRKYDEAKEQYEKAVEQYEKDMEEYHKSEQAYDNWVIWRTARNKWIAEKAKQGLFDEKEPGKEWTEYTRFWVKIAQRVFGISEGTTDEELKTLTSFLYAQIFEDGEQLEQVKDICREYLEWIHAGRIDGDQPIVRQPVEVPEEGEIPGEGPGGGSGGGTTPGEGSGGGATPGDGSGGETNPGDETGGGTTPSEPQGEGPKVKKASITFPTSGVYSAGKEIKITVYFDSKIYGTQEKGAVNVSTAPKLTIKFGTKKEANKIALFDSATEDTIIYKYTISNTDNGQLQIGEGNNYIGTIYGETGAKTELNNITKLETDRIIIANNSNGEPKDEVAPKLKIAKIISPESGTYKKGQEIKIVVEFDKNVYGTSMKAKVNVSTAPKLYIRFGENEKNKIALFDSAEGSTITYKYTISETDKGQLFIGNGENYIGTVYNESGVEAKVNTIAKLETDKIIVADNTTETDKPEEPTDPSDSDEDKKPTDPSDSDEDKKPTDPSDSDEDKKPTDPSDSDEDKKPTDPSDSDEDKKPTDPEEVDKTEAKIQKIVVNSPVNGTYRKGQEIRITVNFDKNIYGATKKVAVDEKTAPKLLIKFGNEGENKTAKFESSNGKIIIYTYQIEETDNGQLYIGTGENFVGTLYNEFDVKSEFKSIETIEEDRTIIADNIGPSVQSIQTIQEAGDYKTGSEIQIKVNFNEGIYGTKDGIRLVRLNVPVLNMSFGNGEIKHPVIKTIDNKENYLIYSYIITAEDRGILNVRGARAFDGTKQIYDAVGNEVTLIAAKDLTGNIITANNNLAQITLDKKEITLDLNGNTTATVTATVNPTVALTWTSTNSSVASVDNTGKITALTIGETEINVTAPDGTKATCKVTVKDTTKGITKVELNNKKLELDLNGKTTENLVATVTPEQLLVTWSSTDEKIVTVEKTTGLVTAISIGKAEIIAKAVDGTTATCEVNVINTNKEEIEPTTIDLNITNAKVVLGKTQELQLTTTIRPSNSNKNTQITYESSDENILTVDTTGKITIKSKGLAVITATTQNGISAYCAIEVIEMAEQPQLQTRKIGDINGDDKIDITDLLTILRYIAASASSTVEEKHQDWDINDEKFVLADVNGNGVIDITDALKVQRHMAASASETIKVNHPDWIIETNWNNN